MRAGPGTTFEALTLIPSGTAVDVTRCARGWCSIEWQGRSGYAIAYGLDGPPLPKMLVALGEPFRPYRSIAAWYWALWSCILGMSISLYACAPILGK